MEQYGVYAALTSTGSSQAIFNHLQRNPSDEVMTTLLAAYIPDFVGDGAALAVESIASALQRLESDALPPLQSSTEIKNVCVTLVYTDELAAQLEVLSSLPFKY